MDFATLKAQLAANRSLAPVVEGATWKLKVPTDYEWHVVFETHLDEHGKVREAPAFRDVLSRALIGWEGVTCRHFGEGSDDPVEFSAEARDLLLDWRPDLSRELCTEIAVQRAARKKRLEGEQKN